MWCAPRTGSCPRTPACSPVPPWRLSAAHRDSGVVSQRERGRDRQTDRDGDGGRDRDRDTDRQSWRERERDRQTDRRTDRQTQTERQGQQNNLFCTQTCNSNIVRITTLFFSSLFFISITLMRHFWSRVIFRGFSRL